MWKILNLQVLLLLPAVVVGQQPSQLPSICDADCQKSCNSTCQAIIQQNYEAEASGWVANTTSDPFYTPPANLSKAVPGDILRWQQISSDEVETNWTIPSGLSLSRFLYVTEDVDGHPIPASAWALLPYENVWSSGGKGQQGKLRTVVWTRGTTGGQNLNCATSNHKSLVNNWRMPFHLAQAGYAVIAPDNAGQGVKLPQGYQYVAGWLHAGDAGYSLAAARQAIGSLLTKEWVVYGFSEGGQTSWRTNERMGSDSAMAKKAGKLIGAISVAPALRPGDPAAGPMTLTASVAMEVVYLYQSLAKVYPDFNMSTYMAEKGMQRLGVLDASCVATGMAAFNSLTTPDVFTNAAIYNSSIYADWVRRYNNPGPHTLAAPMLALHGLADEYVPVNGTIYDYQKTCTALPKSQIQLRLYQYMNHFQTVEASKPYALQWLQDRFDGVAVSGKCSQVQVSPLTSYEVRGAFDWIGVNIG